MTMKIKYETFQGRPTNLKPMPISEVSKLRAGDKVYIFWAKDGRVDDVRVCEVIGGGDIHFPADEVAERGGDNFIEWGGRGDAYFYYPPED